MKYYQCILWFISAATWTVTSILMGIRNNLAAMLAGIVVVLYSIDLGVRAILDQKLIKEMVDKEIRKYESRQSNSTRQRKP